MICQYCGAVCGSLRTAPLIEGSGPILFLLSELPTEADYNDTFFSGRYGRVLTKILEGAGLQRDDCTFASVAGCTGQGRRPTHILQGLLEQKEIILLLGKESSQRVLRKSNIKSSRGQEFSPNKEYGITGRTAGVSWGILDALGNPNYLKVIIQDVRKFTNKSKADDVIEWEWWDGQELPDSDVYSYDIETIDGQGAYTETATQCAVAGANFCYVSRPTKSSAFKLADKLRLKLSENSFTSVGHNSWNFDVPRTRLAGVEDFPLGEDTMVLAYLEDETQSKGLESLSVKHLGVKGWKDQFEHPLGTPEFAAYNARDVIHTYNLYKKELEILGDRIAIYDHILKPAHIALSRMSDRGMFISKGAVEQVREATNTRLGEVNGKIREIVGETFNVGSTKQLGAYFTERGHRLPMSEKGNYSTSSEVLGGLDDPLAHLVLEYRGLAKRLNTYVENYARIVLEGDGRVHPEFSVITTVTGRTSARNQNTQNLDRELKDFFAAPPGCVLLTIDWDAIEFRLAAFLANEDGILKRFAENPDWDPHQYFAALFYRKLESEVTKEERQTAKSANFSQLFCGNAMTMKDFAAGYGLNLDLQVCDSIHESWHRNFPGFVPFYNLTKSELDKNSFVETITGRRRNYGDFKALSWKKKGNALREAVNVKVQGFAADIALLTLVELDRHDYPLVNFVHDSFSFEFKSLQEMEDALPNIMYIMQEYPRIALKEKFNIDLTVPLRAKPEWKCYQWKQPTKSETNSTTSVSVCAGAARHSLTLVTYSPP